MKQVTTLFRRGLAGAALLFSSLCGPAAHAQINWIPAVNPDYSAANAQAVNVENTGNDFAPVQAVAGQPVNYLRVTCWDGDQPGIGWSYSPDKYPGATGTQPLLGSRRKGVVSDPDIVVDPGLWGTAVRPTPSVLVVYIWNGALAYDLYQYDPTINAMQPTSFTPTVLVSNRAGCSNPNVDVDNDGQAVITWAQANTGGIHALVFDLVTQTVYPPCLVAQEPGYWLEQPDVATSREQPGNPKLINTSFVFVANTSVSGTLNPNTVHMVQVSSAQLKNGGVFNQGMGPDVIPAPFLIPSFDAPRIAAGIDGWASPTDFEVVVADLHDNYLYGLNAYNSTGPVSATSLPTVTVLNSFGGLQSKAACYRPAVTFCADCITVCWTMDENYVPGGNPQPSLYGGRDIVQTYLSWDGQQQNFGWGTNVVNYDQRGDQSVPSVSGRYTMDNACYSFFDETQSDILYKSAQYYQYGLRPAGATKSGASASSAKAVTTTAAISAAPNPVREQTTLTLNLAAGEQVQSLTVYSPSGQLVRQQSLEQAAGGQGLQRVQWDGTGLPAGLYLVRLRTSTGALHTYRLLHE